MILPRLSQLLLTIITLLCLSDAAPAPSNHHAHGEKGAVASESATCSQIGISLLKKGGNAADALVGTVFCVGVIGMYHSGFVHPVSTLFIRR